MASTSTGSVTGQQFANTAPESPRAPKAMLARSQSETNKDAFSPLELDFNQKLLLLNVLAEFNGPHIERQAEKETSDTSERELRRDFLDKISYLCDTEKGGRTVTAGALQSLLHGNVLWLAANEGVSDGTRYFVEWMLRNLAKLTHEDKDMTVELIFGQAVGRAHQRISFYQSKLVRFATGCRKAVGKEPKGEEASKLCTWLQKLRNLKSWQELVLTCYEARTKQLVEIRNRVKKPGDEFCELAHYIGRLGAHRHAVLIIVKAWRTVPSLRDIPRVISSPPADPRSVKISIENVVPYNIVKSICARLEPNAARKHLEAFVDIDLKIPLVELMAKNSSFMTRVHAELLILEEFSRHNYKYVDDDKYIGCSKGACYFCYNWIVLHHKGLVSPASHNQVILGCRGLDQDLNKNGAKYYRQMLEKMIGAVEQDILCHLKVQSSIAHQHQSTNGSSRAPSTRASR